MAEKGVVGQYPGYSGFYHTLAGWTCLDPNVPAQCRGKMKTWDLYVKTAGTFKIKLFRSDGDNFIFLDQTILFLGVGSHLGNEWKVDIGKNDYIAFFSADGTTELYSGIGGEYVKPGDIYGTTSILSWTYNNELVLNLRGHIFRRGGAFIL